jgi:hypothetical protein
LRKTIYLKKGSSLLLRLAYDGEKDRPVKKDPGVKFKSSKSKVAKISKAGRIKALRTGTSSMTVTASSGKKLNIKVVVSPKKNLLEKIKVDNLKNTKAPDIKSAYAAKWRTVRGKPFYLGVGMGKSTDVYIKIYSSDKNVLKVDSAGKAWPLKKGKAVITVKAKQKGGKTKAVKKTIFVS